MRYGVSTPNFGDYSDPRLLGELAREAEAAGWDGFFLWDHIVWPWHDTVAVHEPVHDVHQVHAPIRDEAAAVIPKIPPRTLSHRRVRVARSWPLKRIPIEIGGRFLRRVG